MSQRPTRTHRRTARIRGMTLIEIMVVLVIMGMIAGLVAFNVYASKQRADVHAAEIQIHQIRQGVESYRLEKGHLPDSLDELLSARVTTRIRADPWGTPYVYVKSADSFDVRSNGPDRAAGGGDDITDSEEN